jgi:hypothetical protein
LEEKLNPFMENEAAIVMLQILKADSVHFAEISVMICSM